MKVIIEVDGKGTVFKAAREQLAQKQRGRAPDYRLSFESARTLFAELTSARLDLLLNCLSLANLADFFVPTKNSAIAPSRFNFAESKG